MKSEIEILLNQLCAEQGFCLPPKSAQEILSKNCITAEEFSKSVILAEGMSSDIEIKHFRNIKNKFTEKFGNIANENDCQFKNT